MSHLLALLILCPCLPVFADEIQELQAMYATPIPSEIRRNFNQAIHIHQTCPECHPGIVDGEKFLDLYTKKFLLVNLSPNSFGGVWAIIAVEGEPRKAYGLWLYDIGDNEYDLRTIDELPDFLDEQLIRKFWSSDYRDYWR